jgi:hypothetical protein
MAAVRVSGTVTNDDQCAYIKIETLRRKTPSLPPPPPPPLPPLPPPPHGKGFPETKKIQEGLVERETNDFRIRL